MAHRITRRLEIDAGHRLLKHESKCRNIHGHRYVFDISIEALDLDAVGRVIDFGVVKELVGAWLDNSWDHAMIVQQGDPLIPWLIDHNQKHYVVGKPPTAENLARILLDTARGLLSPGGVEVVGVRCYETPNCWADAGIG